MNNLCKDRVNQVVIGVDGEAQRIDNYLLKILKGVPKSHIYRILRSGEVRVNGGRAGPSRRLTEGDKVRIPPIRVAQRDEGAKPRNSMQLPILYEDDHVLAIDKPSGLAVHGGSGVSFGIIEILRVDRPNIPFLELVHRLDKETSGVLLLAKTRTALTHLHGQIRDSLTKKIYVALVWGVWDRAINKIDLPLRKFVSKDGERRVVVDGSEGKPSLTLVRALETHGQTTLIEANLKTGRTHQIRVHLAHKNFPILGDEKYGDFQRNKIFQAYGLKRMFLHAHQFSFTHPELGKRMKIESPIPTELRRVMTVIDESQQKKVLDIP
ncbi:MAG: RluA family pseudouridine synthase [Proteobacteria bacterium]|nr:RluA family pseudouridine synthase [Pseudomonadota bacterium]